MASLAQFRDVQPIDGPDVANEVVAIAYPAEYATLMGYFRAVVSSGEKSPRVMDLTADMIEYNAANYSVWALRRSCVQDMVGEMAYAAEVTRSNPKNYQVWFHRRAILEIAGTGGREELAFISEMLEDDPKNYHAWSHRLWVLNRFECWDGELEYTDKLLSEDSWNNSAWNHRHYVARKLALVESVEVEYAMAKRSSGNESPWIYALSFAKSSEAAWKVLRAACDDETNDLLSARMTRLELLVHRGESLDLALSDATELASLEDPFRAKYWNRRAAKILAKIQGDSR